MVEKRKTGYRQRLRECFIMGESILHTDEELLELLLTYAVPRKDVRPIAGNLIKRFGNLLNVLDSDIETLCKFNGINFYSATLLKLVDWIRTYYPIKRGKQDRSSGIETRQLKLFDDSFIAQTEMKDSPGKTEDSHRGPVLFGKAVLREAIDILPEIPLTSSMKEVTEFLNQKLPFNSAQTRARRARYIKFRMFNDGRVDFALLKFARIYRNSRELRDVCFYRFCKVEKLMTECIVDILFKAIGRGEVERGEIRQYLESRFPESAAVKDCTSAIVEGLTGSGIATKEEKCLRFAFREIPLASFAFVLHSEFPEPGTYDIAGIEGNQAIRIILWDPDRILHSLHELWNQGIISGVSEIGNVREFTTRWTLDQVVERLSIT